MLKTKRWKFVMLVSGLALILAIGGVWLFGNTGVASASKVTAEDLKTITQATALPGLLGEGYLNHGGGWGGRGFAGDIDYTQLLADALGLTTDELQAAYQMARDAAIDRAVEQGLITQEQADQMKVWGGFGGKGFGFGGFGRGRADVPGGAIDEEALLAKALGITTDELQAAREKANQAAIDQAVADGLITQEQADEMQARKDLVSYLDRDTLLAKALGMTAEDLKAAYADGKTLSTLMSEKGLDAVTVREKLTEAYNDALAQAVKDGVITQEQADAAKDGMQNGPGWGLMPGAPFGPGGCEGFRGRDRFNGQRPGAPDTDGGSGMDFRGRGGFQRQAPGTDDTSGMNFRYPQQVTRQAGNDL